MYVGTISNKERSFDIVFGYSHYDYGGSKKSFNKNTVSCGFDTECRQVVAALFTASGMVVGSMADSGPHTFSLH
jgi:hypothetical protein